MYHLFAVLSEQRDVVRERLKARGIETLVHYPIPIPKQPALSTEDPADCPVANRVCGEVFSLPLHPQMSDDMVDEVAAALT